MSKIASLDIYVLVGRRQLPEEMPLDLKNPSKQKKSNLTPSRLRICSHMVFLAKNGSHRPNTTKSLHPVVLVTNQNHKILSDFGQCLTLKAHFSERANQNSQIYTNSDFIPCMEYLHMPHNFVKLF